MLNLLFKRPRASVKKIREREREREREQRTLKKKNNTHTASKSLIVEVFHSATSISFESMYTISLKKEVCDTED